MYPLTTPSANVWATAIGVLVVLIIASLGRYVAVRNKPSDHRRVRLQSLGSWWIVAIIVLATALLGGIAAAVLFMVVSYVAMREFVTLNALEHQSTPVRFAMIIIPLNYLWIILGWEKVFVVFVPLAALLALAAVSMFSSPMKGFVARVAGLQWALLIVVYGMSHGVLLFTLPPEVNPVAGLAGLYLYLLLLTEMNDVAQALVGRRLTLISSHKIAEHISPHKTWEGWIGGCLATVLLSLWLTPVLTPFGGPLELNLGAGRYSLPAGWAVLIGIIISFTGLLGDLVMSSVKRDAGVKDSGRALPGQGGILDRIDSLTFTAPVFYYLALGMLQINM